MNGYSLNRTEAESHIKCSLEVDSREVSLNPFGYRGTVHCRKTLIRVVSYLRLSEERHDVGDGLPTHAISQWMNQHRWREPVVGLIAVSSSTELDRNYPCQDRIPYTARVFPPGLLATRGSNGADTMRVLTELP